jgi:hypothetical protein
MTTDDKGLHESLIAEAMDFLDRDDRERLIVEYGEVLAELRRCPGATGVPMPADDDPDPAVRWSPWARGQMRCDDHRGHVQSRFRLLAQRALNAEDPLWRAWHAFAESAQLAEAVQELDVPLSVGDGE